MPWQAPRFGRPPAPKKAWAKPAGEDRRLRGRPGMRMRERVRREEPLCRTCLDEGRTAATEQVDHIVPLSQGGGNERSNFQGLCGPCHTEKTKAEAAEGRRAAREWTPGGGSDLQGPGRGHR